ncbi:adenosine receptor A1-like isoform X1 [Betta splendens]|uniref:Adenosine receptor A1-like isoform X1 n=1 Tax=Betta splendens TaxID=158456 RepID=A0A6P7KUE5_BETSP|nr:adenosine receptor A1-like isoform X1 [Betta splendens]
MDLVWLYSLSQCILSVLVVVVSVRLCVAIRGNKSVSDVQEQPDGSRLLPGSVSCCLRLCLGWLGAVGGAVEVPVNVLLNLRTPQCLYTCITMVCCPLLVRQFTMFLTVLLTLDAHLQHRLADRYSSVVTRQRTLCVVLLCWVASVLCSFAQFIGSGVFDARRDAGAGSGTAGLGVDGNWTASSPDPAPFPTSRYHRERKVIGKNLPYGGFLSKFYVEDMHKFTYAEVHSSHWGVCAPDIVLSSQFLVYVYGMTVFTLPLLCFLSIYLDLLCMKPRKASFSHAHVPQHVRFLALSLSLLVLLCLPVLIVHVLLLFPHSTNLPTWVHAVAQFLFQMYSVVPQILFTPPHKKPKEKQAFPLSIPNLPPAAKHSLKAKVCPEV